MKWMNKDVVQTSHPCRVLHITWPFGIPCTFCFLNSQQFDRLMWISKVHFCLRCWFTGDLCTLTVKIPEDSQTFQERWEGCLVQHSWGHDFPIWCKMSLYSYWKILMEQCVHHRAHIPSLLYDKTAQSSDPTLLGYLAIILMISLIYSIAQYWA